MRRELIRSTILSVGVTLGVFAVPLLVVLAWLAGLAPADRQREITRLADHDNLLIAFIVVVVLSFAALAAGWYVGSWRSGELTTTLARLADDADRLGRGESRLEPLSTGIGEVDRVHNVLARSAQQITKNLASERDFAADASHQLRTPLTALLMRLEEIAATDDLAVVAEEAPIAIAQVERLSRVVDDLMGRSRRSTETRPSVSLDTVLASLQREWQPAFERARRSVHVQGERGLKVRSTPVALAQILSTLLENSLSHGKGTVEIAARRSGPSVVVEVSDQGDGVSATIAPHIFERSVSSKGSGLGLTLARDLAESNGGRLELISAQPAVFALFLSEAED